MIHLSLRLSLSSTHTEKNVEEWGKDRKGHYGKKFQITQKAKC